MRLSSQAMILNESKFITEKAVHTSVYRGMSDRFETLVQFLSVEIWKKKEVLTVKRYIIYRQ